MQALRFECGGRHYSVNQQGHIRLIGLAACGDQWRFLGGTKHHWSNKIDFSLTEILVNPTVLNGCLIWDMDHGTVRRWGGQYCGKLPRVRNAFLAEENHDKKRVRNTTGNT